MLKWAVIKRTSEDESKVLPDPVTEVLYRDPINTPKSKFRRYSNNFKGHNVEFKSTSKFNSKRNKEKRFTSTPVKSVKNHHVVFGDVRNKTPKILNNKIITKRNIEQKKLLNSNQSFDLKNEKESLKSPNKSTLKTNNLLKYSNSFHKSYFKPLGLAKSHVHTFSEQNCYCKCNFNLSLRSDCHYYYSPTLPTLEVEDSHISVPNDFNLNILIPDCSTTNSLEMYKLHENDEPLKKKIRCDPINNPNIDDVLSNTDSKVAFVIDEVNRVKQLINFNFSKIIVDESKNCTSKEVKRSCRTNDWTLNIIVYTMIEKSSNVIDPSEMNKFYEKYSGLLINLQVKLQNLEHEVRKFHDENLKNTLHKTQFNAALNPEFSSETTNHMHVNDKDLQHSTVSTFLNKEIKKSSVIEICHGANSSCDGSSMEPTMIDFNNTSGYSENWAHRGRKRFYSTLISNEFNQEPQEDTSVEFDSDKKCRLKRQNCIRRIKRLM